MFWIFEIGFSNPLHIAFLVMEDVANREIFASSLLTDYSSLEKEGREGGVPKWPAGLHLWASDPRYDLLKHSSDSVTLLLQQCTAPLVQD